MRINKKWLKKPHLKKKMTMTEGTKHKIKYTRNKNRIDYVENFTNCRWRWVWLYLLKIRKTHRMPRVAKKRLFTTSQNRLVVNSSRCIVN